MSPTGSAASLEGGYETRLPFEEHESAENRPDAVREATVSRRFDDRIHISWIEMVRRVERLEPDIRCSLSDGDRLVGNDVDGHERGELTAVGLAVVVVPLIVRAERKPGMDFEDR